MKKVCKHALAEWWQLFARNRGTLVKTGWSGIFACRCCERYFNLDGTRLQFLGIRKTLDQAYCTWQVGDTSDVLYRAERGEDEK